MDSREPSSSPQWIGCHGRAPARRGEGSALDARVDEPQRFAKTWTHYVSNEKVQQVQIEVDLQAADRLIQSGNATTYYADLRQSFLECYKKDGDFQMTVLGLETATWRLQVRSRFKYEVH